MEQIKNISPGNIILQLPLRINYGVLEDIIRDRAIGEKLGTIDEKGETTNYAEILDISFGESLKENFDFAINLKFKTLTRLFKNKVGKLEIDLAIHFAEATQEVFIRDYKLEGDTTNWLMNNFIEKMVNKVLYGKLKKKMNFNLRPVISKQLEEINQKFGNGISPKEGIVLEGKIDSAKIDRLEPSNSFLLVQVSLKAEAAVAVEHLNLAELRK
ncbi:DUF4403 family protein [Zunongwangia sp. H14]|uniref:DUF4403 family protein n=1 Tax=Zunongwangia sp. H14 TaxID=3240792 RepID=UPI003562B4DB